MNDQASTGTQITGLRTVAVPVTDQDRAVAFYVGKLGFEKRLDAPLGGGQRWIEVAPPGAEATIALVASRPDAPAGVDTGIRLASGDAAADHAALRGRGADTDPEVLRWPGVPPMFTFRDQDGNRLVIVEQA
jgi:catechol 2,3-dioxygenase-like lactoylglutathione lyase family enzyme